MSIVPAKKTSANPAFDLPLRKDRGSCEVFVTPEIAQHWLGFNSSNRAMTNSRIDQFRSDMESGDWSDNAEPIKFAYGKLLDGQHRLTAMVLSGVSLQLSIAHGLDPKTQVTMDTGRVRTPRDVLSIEGVGKWESGVLGTAAHSILAVKMGGLPSSSAKFTNREIRAFFLENRAAIEYSLQVVRDLPRKPTPLPFSRVLSLHYLFAERDRDLADMFFQRLFNGDQLAIKSPIFHLRNRLINDAVNKSRRSSFVECAFVINAWNAVRRGGSWKNSTALYPKDGDLLSIA